MITRTYIVPVDGRAIEVMVVTSADGDTARVVDPSWLREDLVVQARAMAIAGHRRWMRSEGPTLVVDNTAGAPVHVEAGRCRA